jgi:Tfp pilus assembly protein PilX
MKTRHSQLDAVRASTRSGNTNLQHSRSGAALLASMFVMSAVSLIVIGILRTESVQFAALRNTIDYDRARYLAEAGMNHAVSQLETDISWRGTIRRTEFPARSGEFYQAIAEDGVNGTVVVTGMGEAGDFSRTVQVVVKQGG